MTASAIALKKMIHFCILIPSRNLRGYTRRLESTRQNRATKVLVDVAALLRWARQSTALIVHLDYSAGVVQHADNCPLRPGVGAILRVRYRVTDCVGPCIPDRAVSKQLTD